MTAFPDENGEGAAVAGEDGDGDGAALPATILPPGGSALVPGDRFERYLSQVNRFPLLSEEEEHLLARSWRERRERRALERLVTSHLRLVARLALGYRGYGLALSDLVSEGTLGLLRAAERFDPDRRVRLSTYASWWIRAAIQEYILRSWSLVKIGGGAERRRLFFGLRSLRNRLEQYDERLGEGADRAGAMAKILDVDESVVREMQQRLGERDLSLHAPLGAADGGDDGGAVWLDRIPADEDTPEALAEAEEESRLRRRFLEEALESLSERDREILVARRLAEEAESLEVLGERHGVSAERVRQIEKRAFGLLKRRLLAIAAREGLAPEPSTD
ncbi:MAG: RNA polymerase factor sigma-32 [Alphaproteobacteria bacterium]|nr:RNA polymerase factor sigma-32 [Alphaproteobacteria bacterium]